jgi:hypothetical protein
VREIYSKYRFIFLITILLLSIENIYAQNLKVAVDKKNILIGEQITLDFFIQHNKGEAVQITIPDSIPHFDIIEKKGIDTTLDNGINVIQQKIIFTSFDSGKWSFPPINYTVNNIDGSTDSVEINVGYMPIDSSAAPRDIKTVLEVDYFNWMWVWLGIAILLVCIIAFIIYKYLSKKYELPADREKVDAYKEAMAALAILQKENEENILSVKDYHTKLANVFKNYCGKITFQNFFNFTTTEVLAKLKTYEINVQTSSEATEALQTGDATKFAKYHPSFIENEAALNFIKNTITEIEKSRTKNT